MKIVDPGVILFAALSLVAADTVCVSSAPPGAVNDPILSSVQAVRAPLSTLNSLVVNWKDSDGLMGALAIQQSYYPLYSAVLSLSSAIVQPPSIAPNDAGIYIGSLNTLVGDISVLMGSLDAKANAFAGVGAAQIVVGDITSLAGPASFIEAQAFAALPSNVPCAFQQSAASVASQFSAAFASAASTYSISTGIPAFPTAPTACASYCANKPSSSPAAATSSVVVVQSSASVTAGSPGGACISSAAPGSVNDPILSSVQAVRAPLSTLNSLVLNWKDSDGLMGALGIQQSYYPLYSAVLSLSSAIVQPPSIAPNNAGIYIDSLNTLVGDISTLMGSLNAKANAFAGVGAAQIVVGDITSLAGPASFIEAQAFAALPSNVPCVFQASAVAVANQFSSAFAGAASAYSITQGIPAFPAAPTGCATYCAGGSGESSAAAASSPVAASSSKAASSSAPAVASSSKAASSSAPIVASSVPVAASSAGPCVSSAAPGTVNDPILSSVQAVRAPLSTLNSLVLNWKDSDGLMGALGIQQSYYPLYSAVLSLSSAIVQPPSIAPNNAGIYIDSLNTLVGDISTLMGSLNAKANAFAGVGAAQIVVGDITSLAGPASFIEAQAFAALPSNVPCVFQASAVAVANQFSSAFAGAASAYSITQGIPAFPAAPTGCATYCAGGAGGSSAVSTSSPVAASSSKSASSSAPAVASSSKAASSSAPVVASSSKAASSSAPAVATSSAAASTSAPAVASSSKAAPSSVPVAASSAGPCVSSAAPGTVNDPILSSVQAVSAPLSTLNSLVLNWKDSDGLMGALGIQQSYYPLYSAVLSLSAAIVQPPSIAPNNAGIYIDSLNTLVGDISTLMGSLNAKANAFAGVGAAQIVVGDITSLAGPASFIEAQAFAALPSNVPCVFQASAVAVANQFSSAFAGAASAYSITQGIPAFPAAPTGCATYCAGGSGGSSAAAASSPVAASSSKAASSSAPAVVTSSAAASSSAPVVASSSKAASSSAPVVTSSSKASSSSAPAVASSSKAASSSAPIVTSSSKAASNSVPVAASSAGPCVSSAAPSTVNDPILSSVQAVRAPLSTLNSLVLNWKDSDGLMGALGIQQSYYPLYSAVLSLSSAIAQPPSIAPNNAGIYIDSLNTLVGDISTLMGSLNAKANAFAGVGAAQIVVGDITSLAGPASFIEAQAFAALPSNVPCVFQASAVAVANQFSSAFAGAASAYSITQGIPAFPAAPNGCATYCAGGAGGSSAVPTSNPVATSSSKAASSSAPAVVTSSAAVFSSAPAITSSSKAASSSAPAMASSSKAASSSAPVVTSSSKAASSSAPAVASSSKAASSSAPVVASSSKPAPSSVPVAASSAGPCVSSAAPGTVNDPILSSVQAVRAPLSTLNSLVLNWKDSDGLMGALGIQQSYYPLYSAVLSLSSAIAQPPSIAPNNAGIYIDSLNTLVGDISTLMGSLNAKANAFAGVGAAQIVVGDITSLAGPASFIEAQAFAALPSNVPCVFQASAVAVASQFSSAFAGAASAYSITQGIPAFPAAPTGCATYCAGGAGGSSAVATSRLTTTSTNVVSSSPPTVTSSTRMITTSSPVVTSASRSTVQPSSTISAPPSTTTQTAPTSTQVQVLVDDITRLTSSIKSLDSQVKSFKHGFFSDIVPLFKLHNAAVDLGTEIQKVTKDFAATSRLNPSDTTKIAGPLLAMIDPLKATLSDIGQKKGEFDKAILGFISVSGLIKGHLVHLKEVSDQLIAQVKSTVDPSFAGVISPLASQVDDAFNAQINGVYRKVPTIYIPFKLF